MTTWNHTKLRIVCMIPKICYRWLSRHVASPQQSYRWDIHHSRTRVPQANIRAGKSNYVPQYLWNVITFPCPWYMLLAHQFPYGITLQKTTLIEHKRAQSSRKYNTNSYLHIFCHHNWPSIQKHSYSCSSNTVAKIICIYSGSNCINV